MKTLLSYKTAANTMLFLFSIVLVFHILVITGLIPFKNVWGGQLKTREEMLVFESISIALNLLMMGVVAVKAGYWKINVSTRLITILLWVMVTLFALNTIGNLFANSLLEQLFGTLGTLILALLSLRLAIEK